MKKAVVMDQSGFERPIPQPSMLLPGGLAIQGRVTWNCNGDCSLTTSYIRASGPDGADAPRYLLAGD